MTTLPFLLLALSPFVIFDSDNPLISCPLCKSKTLWNIFMILGRNVEQNQMIYVSHTRMTTLAFLLLVLSPFIIFDRLSIDTVSQRPFGIFLVILGRNVEQDQMTCHVHE